MRPYVVGGACHRVLKHVDTALSVGALALPTELAAHAERCAHCGPHLRETEELFRRLRSSPASIDLGPVPGVVDSVLQRIATPAPPQVTPILTDPVKVARKRRQHASWVIGQVATIAAVLCLALGGFTYLVLKVNEAVSGVAPGQVVERWVAPLQNWSQALFENTK